MSQRVPHHVYASVQACSEPDLGLMCTGDKNRVYFLYKDVFKTLSKHKVVYTVIYTKMCPWNIFGLEINVMWGY